MRIQESPLFIDPIYAGTADPTIIWNHIENEWWIVYTQRMASIPGPAVTGVHGSELGVASSKDGSDWVYRGTLEGLHFEHGHNIPSGLQRSFSGTAFIICTSHT